MFSCIYKYTLKVILRDRITVFWLLIYPLILSSIFSFCFTNLLDGESFEKINIAIIEKENMPPQLLTAIDESDLFIVRDTDMNLAKELLSAGEITAIVTCNEKPELTVYKEGMSESITKVFFDNYLQYSTAVADIIKNNPELLQNGYFNDIDLSVSNVKNIPIGSSTNVVVIFFYSMLAMTCLMSANIGSDMVSRIQANQSDIAARINLAPTHKMKSFIAFIASAMTFHYGSVLITLFYIDRILGIEFGDAIGYILLLCFVGSLMGMAFGAFISAVIKKKEGVKTAVILTVVLFGCFLAGMMNVDMKYIVQAKAPVAAYINPANLITDGLYSLYYYDTMTRYFVNLGLLGVYTVIFSVLSYLILRRQKYASL